LKQTLRSDPHFMQDSSRPGAPGSLCSVPHFQQCRVMAIKPDFSPTTSSFPAEFLTSLTPAIGTREAWWSAPPLGRFFWWRHNIVKTGGLGKLSGSSPSS
jgi:hypothetical protein